MADDQPGGVGRPDHRAQLRQRGQPIGESRGPIGTRRRHVRPLVCGRHAVVPGIGWSAVGLNRRGRGAPVQVGEEGSEPARRIGRSRRNRVQVDPVVAPKPRAAGPGKQVPSFAVRMTGRYAYAGFARPAGERELRLDRRLRRGLGEHLFERVTGRTDLESPDLSQCAPRSSGHLDVAVPAERHPRVRHQLLDHNQATIDSRRRERHNKFRGLEYLMRTSVLTADSPLPPLRATNSPTKPPP
jgi:hypothetical protein